MTSQMRRSTVSIAANIAEGCGRGSDADFARFCTMAAGSASEVEYHLMLSVDLGYLEKEDYTRLHAAVTQIKRMFTALIKKLKADR